MAAFKRALDAVGGQTAMARRLTDITGHKFTQRRVWAWKDRGNVPAKWVPYISSVSGVPAGDINPAFKVLRDNAA